MHSRTSLIELSLESTVQMQYACSVRFNEVKLNAVVSHAVIAERGGSQNLTAHAADPESGAPWNRLRVSHC